MGGWGGNGWKSLVLGRVCGFWAHLAIGLCSDLVGMCVGVSLKGCRMGTSLGRVWVVEGGLWGD